MEILIPGLILVALMVWASTRIKRNAAQAFEAEHIEGVGFELEKPAGFLNRIDARDGYLFDAYSKEFGTGPASELRLATAVVFESGNTIHETATLEQTRLLNSERSEQFELDGSDCIIITGEVVDEGRSFEVSEKMISRDGQTFVLRIESLKEPSAELQRKIEKMLLSFGPK